MSKQAEKELLGESDIKTPAAKEVKPEKKAKTEEKKTIDLPNLHAQLKAQREEQVAKIKMPKLGELVAFRRAEEDKVVEYIAMAMSNPRSSTVLDLNVHKPGYIDFAKNIPFCEEKQSGTWGFLDNE